jgi:hypothetical protein
VRGVQRRVVSPPSVAGTRVLLVERLRGRWCEIEEAAITRLYGVSAAPERPDPDYAEGLRSATSAALAYLLAGVEQGKTEDLQLPPAVQVQARLAARNRVSLDIVVRRCFAGHALFGDFLMGELECLGDAEPELPKLLWREQAALFDRMLRAVSEEYQREAASGAAATDKRRTRLVERLLAGEPMDASDLRYGFEVHHLNGRPVGDVLAVVLACGVLWSNALAYGGVNLAPSLPPRSRWQRRLGAAHARLPCAAGRKSRRGVRWTLTRSISGASLPTARWCFAAQLPRRHAFGGSSRPRL